MILSHKVALIYKYTLNVHPDMFYIKRVLKKAYPTTQQPFGFPGTVTFPTTLVSLGTDVIASITGHLNSTHAAF